MIKYTKRQRSIEDKKGNNIKKINTVITDDEDIDKFTEEDKNIKIEFGSSTEINSDETIEKVLSENSNISEQGQNEQVCQQQKGIKKLPKPKAISNILANQELSKLTWEITVEQVSIDSFHEEKKFYVFNDNRWEFELLKLNNSSIFIYSFKKTETKEIKNKQNLLKEIKEIKGLDKKLEEPKKRNRKKVSYKEEDYNFEYSEEFFNSIGNGKNNLNI